MRTSALMVPRTVSSTPRGLHTAASHDCSSLTMSRTTNSPWSATRPSRSNACAVAVADGAPKRYCSIEFTSDCTAPPSFRIVSDTNLGLSRETEKHTRTQRNTHKSMFVSSAASVRPSSGSVSVDSASTSVRRASTAYSVARSVGGVPGTSAIPPEMFCTRTPRQTVRRHTSEEPRGDTD